VVTESKKGGKKRKMVKQQKIAEEEKKTYANPILYLRKSKKGGHLYAFNVENEGEKDVLGNEVESLIANISDVSAVINGEMDWCKVSVLAKGDKE
jgi:hypothetical protein